MIFCKQLAGKRQQFIRQNRPGKKGDVLAGILVALFAGIPQHKDGNGGYPRVQFRHKRRASDAGQVVSGDDKAKAGGKPGLFNQTQRIRGARHAKYI